MARIILSFIICLFAIQAFACSCGGPRSFCEYITQAPSRGPELVVKGIKLRNVDHGMDFEISEIYKGVETKKVIRIWGDLGWLCRWYAGSFADGEEYYFGLFEIVEDTENPWSQTNPVSPLEEEGDYVISFCGKSYWHKSDEELRNEMEVDLINCLSELPSNTSQIVNTTKDEDFCDIEKSALFPNPAAFKTYIHLSEEKELTEGTARIYDDCGKLVYQWNNIRQFYSLGQLNFKVSSFTPGLYFLDVNLPELCESNLTRRLVVYK